MSTTTGNLGLFKYDTVLDSNVPFNIDTALNANWDIIDERCGSQRNIGEIVTSTLPLEDAGLHLLDGALIQGSGSYSAFVTYMVGLKTTYPDLFTTESLWQSEVQTTGVCGKFVHDTTNNTIRLPKFGNQIWSGEGTAPVVGNGMTLGLTNGTLNVGLDGTLANYSPSALGCDSNLFGKDVGTTVSQQWNTSGVGYGLGVTNDSTKSGLVAQLSDITTSLDGYYYIVIATSTKTNIQVDIDEIATDLNNKADLRDMTEVQCIVETYQDGYSWYRIWSDGWLEQGGTWGQNNAAYAQYTVEFMKTFANMNYTLFVQGNWSDATATSCRIDERTLSGFKGIMANNLYSTMPSYWYACGILGV